MIVYDDLVQGTEEWLQARLGIITASTVGTLITPTGKAARNAGSRALLYVLAAERVTGRPQEHYETYDMRRGHLEEEMARELYCRHSGKDVKEVGFIRNGHLGFSPDGLVGDDGLIEIKSRKAKFQVQTYLEDDVPAEYMAQIQAGLVVTGREWCDFVQYSNGMHLFVKRVYPDQKWSEVIEEAVEQGEQRICEIVEEYNTKAAGMPLANYVEEYDMGEIDA